MIVASSRTQEDAPATPEGAVAFLTPVLTYDDLLAAESAAWEVYPLSEKGRPLRIGRAEDAAPAAGPSGSMSPLMSPAGSPAGSPAAAPSPGSFLGGRVVGAGGDGAGEPGGLELRLPDRFLSGAHAEVVARGPGHALRDLGSRNGTFVNGTRITERPLEDGDLIEVGHTLLCYRTVPERTYQLFAAALLAGGVTLGPTRTVCPEVVGLVRDLDRIAPSREAVLILAETGAGKEVAAQAVHERSGRGGALCTVDCGAVPESLFESVFFGHRRGAYTGATADQTGLITRAHRGTLFLDEVANMSRPAQAKLLRVIEEGRVTPLGAAQPVAVDVRWVAATNIDLFAAGGVFREDLLRRLGGYVARIPPLRRRREDLGILTAHLLREAGATRAAIAAPAGRRLFSGAFPGNIRQLRSALRGAVLLAPDGRIEAEHLGAPEPLSGSTPGEENREPTGEGAVLRARDPREPREPREPAPAGPPSSEAVDEALRATRGNVVRAAARLGLHPRQLYRLVERFGLALDRYRTSG